MSPSARPTSLDPDQDARIVARCLNGEARAWDELVRRHERLVYAVARGWRLSDEDLADVFQEVFAALVRGLPRLRDARSLVRWLSSTTDRLARATALRRRRETSLRAGDDDSVRELAADDAPVGADLERLERQATVRLALSAIPPRCQRLLAALYYEDPPPAYGELARRLGVPVGSLGPTRARCMQKLREALAAGARDGISAPDAATSLAARKPGPRDPRRGRRPGAAGLPAEKP